jgi:hypothetical protein
MIKRPKRRELLRLLRKKLKMREKLKRQKKLLFQLKRENSSK